MPMFTLTHLSVGVLIQRETCEGRSRFDARCLTRSGSEELDRVARGIVDDHLVAADAVDDLTASRHAAPAQAFHFAGEIVDDELKPVPAAGLRAPVAGQDLAT